MNLALFGGSFDPPHTGHDSIVKNALTHLNIDVLLVVPTFISLFKDEFSAPPELRFEWAKKLWGNLSKVQIDDFEILQNRPVPTIQTVRYFYNKFDVSKFYLIIGADHIASLKKWHEIDELKKLCEFIVAKRNHIKIPAEFKKLDIHEDISSSRIRNELNYDKIPQIIKKEVINFYQGNK
ncbi:MAG: nicotinate (nicotinamide) nucleotide adenylyltransferase [Campylobacter sp.]|nr:nicotinate (nicotinamide) nucleotide adenylyltransferase [Campylobacter sp.]